MINFLTATVDPAAGMGSTVIMMVVMLGVFYFMLIRPENKRKKEAEQTRNSVKNGDEITTIGGIVGTVVNVKEDKIVIETSADQVRVELMKWAISTNETAAAAAREEAKKKQEAKAKAKAAKKAEKNMKKKPGIRLYPGAVYAFLRFRICIVQMRKLVETNRIPTAIAPAMPMVCIPVSAKPAISPFTAWVIV